MVTVVGSAKTRAVRVLWALEEMGVPYTHIPEQPRSPAVVALHPLGKIPILKDGDTVIADSVAIITYLADRNGALTAPSGSLARASQDAMTQFAVTELEAPLWTRAKHSFVLPENARVPAIKPAVDAEVERAFSQLASLMEGRPFAAGDSFTIADILIGHCASWATRVGIPLPDGATAEYLERIQSRPALTRARAAP
ncbi:MAG: glutathione S-transferase family protein [Pseudomonadota bacterium]